MKQTFQFLMHEAQNGNQKAIDILNMGNTMNIEEKDTHFVLTEKNEIVQSKK